MKKCSELGISSAPWKRTGDWLVANAKYDPVDGTTSETRVVETESSADAQFIAAAPRTHDAGCDLVRCLRDWLRKYPPAEFSTFGSAWQNLLSAMNRMEDALKSAEVNHD